MTVLTGGFAAPAALAWGGFAAGFSGTLFNGGSIGQAFGMGFVGAFAGGVGGVAFSGLHNIARIAALTAIGATAGASGAAIMGGNIGLGAAAGAAGGFLGGAVGGRLADKWNPGLARTAAGIGTGAGAGAASAAIAGGSPGMGAALGGFSVAAAVAAGKLQTAIDAARARGGEAAVGETAQLASNQEQARTLASYAPRQMGAEGAESHVSSALTTDQAKLLNIALKIQHRLDTLAAAGGMVSSGLLVAGASLASIGAVGASTGPVGATLYGLTVAGPNALVGMGIAYAGLDLAFDGKLPGALPEIRENH